MTFPPKLSGAKKALVGALILFAFLLTVDLLREPGDQITARALIGSIAFYQAHLSSHTHTHCKFEPTCSEYAKLAIGKYGAFKGSMLAAWRLLRCSPFTKEFSVDYP